MILFARKRYDRGILEMGSCIASPDEFRRDQLPFQDGAPDIDGKTNVIASHFLRIPLLRELM